MPITRTPMIDDDGSGNTGTILNNSWKQELYSQIDALTTGDLESLIVTGNITAGAAFLEAGRATALGYGVDVPYAAGNFTSSSGTWTVEAGDVQLLRYHLVGKLAHVAFRVVNTSVTGTPSELRITVPMAITGGALTGIGRGVINYTDAGGAVAYGNCSMHLAASTYISLLKANMVAWSAATNNTTINGSIWYEIA